MKEFFNNQIDTIVHFRMPLTNKSIAQNKKIAAFISTTKKQKQNCI